MFKTNFPQAREICKEARESKYYFGLDLHLKTIAVTILDKGGKKRYQKKRCLNRDFIELIKRYKGKKTLICESSIGWKLLKDALERSEIRDYILIVLDPRKTSAWTKSSGIKNDKIDSHVLAYMGLRGNLESLLIYQLEDEYLENYKLVVTRDKYIKQRVMVKNELRSIEQNYDVNPYTGEEIGSKIKIEKIRNKLENTIGHLDIKIKEIDKEIKEISKDDEIVDILLSIPGIGILNAFSIRYKIGNIDRFGSHKKLASYFGLGIRQYQSGDSDRRGNITKTGDVMIRKNLIEGCRTIKIHHPEYVLLYCPNVDTIRYSKSSSYRNKITVNIARKTIKFIYRCWKSKIRFDINKYTLMRKEMNLIKNIEYANN